MLTLKAPAKINLTLEALGKRADGFHEIRSLIQTISLCDTLHFEPGRAITFTSDIPEWRGESSLVSKAVALLKKETDYSGGAAVSIQKRIPLMSGLGGDSSDAAAVLRGLNRLWALNLPQEKLLEMARQLGSDVSFFLYGGTALLEGRGEIITALPPLPHNWLVLALPPVPRSAGKTAQLYASLRRNHFTDGDITRRAVEAVKNGGAFPPSLLFNTFENTAFTVFPGLAAAKEHFLKLGAPDVHLSGTGPALFSLMPDKDAAERLYALLQRQNMPAYLAETLAANDVT